MYEIGQHYAKRDKPVSKIQRTNDLTDKRMMTHNGGWEQCKNGERRDCIVGKEGWEGWGEGKKIRE